MTLKYDEHGRPYEDLTEENKKLNSRIQQLDKSLKMALEINDNYQRDVKKLQDQVRAAEGETSIIKGIGINSPEMRAMKKEVEAVKAELAREKEDRQYDNLVHQQELNKLFKRHGSGS